MTDTTERATALVDRIINMPKSWVPIDGEVTNITFTTTESDLIVTALRSLAAQDQKPFAWCSALDPLQPFVTDYQKQDMGRCCAPGIADRYDCPLYLSPPPAAGWDDAIETACKICSFAIDQTHNMSRMAMAEELRDAIEALRHNAPPYTGAGKYQPCKYSGPCGLKSDVPDHGGAGAGVRVKPLEWTTAPNGWTTTGVGFRYVVFHHTGRICVDLDGHGFIAWCDTEEEGKAAAQADYERRVLSALSHQPAAAEETQWPANLHPRTLDLVKRFAVALAKKLRLAEEKYGYNDGWSHDDWEIGCREHLYQHLDKGDPRDVAAYCAFMWHHGWITSRPAAAESNRDFSKVEIDSNFYFSWPSPSDHTASDCDKQEQERELTKREQYCVAAALLASGTVVDETTKSEGGTEGRARSTKADSARGEAGSAPSQDGSLAQLAAGIESGPSDRTADVTWGELHAFILKHSDEWESEGVAARALLDAYGMWRR